ncbi:MAG: nascent polypeptide-associated complex protein [Candidatus Woesearchaeota archaeon]
MIPGMNSRQAQQMMRKMGIQQVELDAIEVRIKLADKELVFSQPEVSKVNMMGQETFQIVGTPEEVALSVSVSEDDIQTVVDQTGVDFDTAKEAIESCDGDLAQAILKLSE